MKRIVITQPFFFPWVGLFEQLRLADVFVHYDDVQYSKGHFANRVQLKTPEGTTWMTVPLRDHRLGQQIREVAMDDRQNWRGKHLALLARHYEAAPHRDEMMDLVKAVYANTYASVGDLSIASIHAICDYFGLNEGRTFLRSSEMEVPGRSSERVVDVVRHLECDVYITGHGAKNYLDHDLFESHGIRVEYIDYKKVSYPQQHGAFTPYVSTLDLIANRGRDGLEVICSGSVYWREFIAREASVAAV